MSNFLESIQEAVRGVISDLNNPPPSSREMMTQEDREAIRELILDTLYNEESRRISKFVVEGAKVVCTSMEEYQSNSLMRKLTDEERENNLAEIDASRIGGRTKAASGGQTIAYRGMNYRSVQRTNEATMLDHMDIKFEPVFGMFEGLTASDVILISDAVRERSPSVSPVEHNLNSMHQLSGLDHVDVNDCGKCKHSDDGKCKPDIEHLMWQDTDGDVRLAGGDAAGSETLLKNSAYMFCHHGQGILYITESGQHHFGIIDKLGLDMQDPAEALLAHLLARGIPFPPDMTDEEKLEFARRLLGDLRRLQGLDRNGLAFIFLSDPELAMHITCLDLRMDLLRIFLDNDDSRQWGSLVREFLASPGPEIDKIDNVNNFGWRWFGMLTLDAQIILTHNSASQGTGFHDWYTFLATTAWLDGAARITQNTMQQNNFRNSLRNPPRTPRVVGQDSWSSRSSQGSLPFSERGKLDVNNIQGMKNTFRGKTVNQIADILRNQGYDVTIRESTKSRSGAMIIEINNQGGARNISQVQVSPGGGRHGGPPYVKISTNQGTFRIIDGSPSDFRVIEQQNAIDIFIGGD